MLRVVLRVVLRFVPMSVLIVVFMFAGTARALAGARLVRGCLGSVVRAFVGAGDVVVVVVSRAGSVRVLVSMGVITGHNGDDGSTGAAKDNEFNQGSFPVALIIESLWRDLGETDVQNSPRTQC